MTSSTFDQRKRQSVACRPPFFERLDASQFQSEMMFWEGFHLEKQHASLVVAAFRSRVTRSPVLLLNIYGFICNTVPLQHKCPSVNHLPVERECSASVLTEQCKLSTRSICNLYIFEPNYITFAPFIVLRLEQARFAPLFCVALASCAAERESWSRGDGSVIAEWDIVADWVNKLDCAKCGWVCEDGGPLR